MHIRHEQSALINFKKLETIFNHNTEQAIGSLTTRQLKSVCDIYVDYGNEVESRNEMILSTFLNMIRLGETFYRCTNQVESEENISLLKRKKAKLYDGLTTLSIEIQDTCLNMAKRMIKLFEDTPLILRMYENVIERIKGEPLSMLNKLANHSERPSYFFPANACELEDNYGVK